MAVIVRTSVLIIVKTVCQKRAGSLLIRRRQRYVCCYGSCKGTGENVSS